MREHRHTTSTCRTIEWQAAASALWMGPEVQSRASLLDGDVASAPDETGSAIVPFRPLSISNLIVETVKLVADLYKVIFCDMIVFGITLLVNATTPGSSLSGSVKKSPWMN